MAEEVCTSDLIAIDFSSCVYVDLLRVSAAVGSVLWLKVCGKMRRPQAAAIV